MLTKNKLKELRFFQQKKYRDTHEVFIVEGTKSVCEVLQSDWQIETLVAFEKWIGKYASELSSDACLSATTEQLSKLSLLHTPQDVWAVVKRKKTIHTTSSAVTLVLDGIRNPGNMGTILRIMDWFGYSHIMCSHDCVDVFNPKVVQASMGAILRIQVSYQDLPSVLSEATVPIFAACMQGNNIYTESLPNQAYVVLGNEGDGISDEVLQFVSTRIAIPSGVKSSGAESLNVGVAAGIICSEFFRVNFK
ncbi:MAG: RNA methyltransferase [Bacteroidales bacterium]|jgi:TrmH family RNA methyltransferase|nr:RNA methyltransferase [Bacteroidales bacterium]